MPFGMSEYYGYDSIIATYENERYPNMQYLPGVKLEFVLKVTGNWYIDSSLWLLRNSRRIDVLFQQHIGCMPFMQMRAYKLLNPKGKVYLKFDGWPLPNDGGRLKRPFYEWMVKNSVCASTELEGNIEMMSREWKREITWVPNPANPAELHEYRPFSKRSNVILAVGRMGTKQKATDILLEAFVKIQSQIPDWTLKCAGRIEENMNIASDFYAKYPELRERVIFTGDIRDRDTLIEMYRDAKIFAFPSRWESWGIALGEAIMQGDFPVVSNIPSSQYLTYDYRFAFAHEIDDSDGLAEKLLYACTHEDEIERLAIEGRNKTLEQCDLKRVCGIIADKLK